MNNNNIILIIIFICRKLCSDLFILSITKKSSEYVPIPVLF